MYHTSARGYQWWTLYEGREEETCDFSVISVFMWTKSNPPKQILNQARWYVPIVPATWESGEGRSFEPRIARTTWETQALPTRKEKKTSREILASFVKFLGKWKAGSIHTDMQVLRKALKSPDSHVWLDLQSVWSEVKAKTELLTIWLTAEGMLWPRQLKT